MVNSRWNRKTVRQQKNAGHLKMTGAFDAPLKRSRPHAPGILQSFTLAGAVFAAVSSWRLFLALRCLAGNKGFLPPDVIVNQVLSCQSDPAKTSFTKN